MIERLIISVVTNLGSWLITKGLSKLQKKNKKFVYKDEIRDRISSVETALLKVQDGQPATPEQKQQFKKAVVDLVRGSYYEEKSHSPKN